MCTESGAKYQKSKSILLSVHDSFLETTSSGQSLKIEKPNNIKTVAIKEKRPHQDIYLKSATYVMSEGD